MGIMDYPQIQDYWLTSWAFIYDIDLFLSDEPRQIFLILRFLHLNDNTGYKQKKSLDMMPSIKSGHFLPST